MSELIETESDYRHIEDNHKQEKNNSILVRHPRPEDGRKIWCLVKDTGILDLNSVYCYLLLCKQFSNTCLVAEKNNRLIGFVTTYKIPDNNTTLFVWQTGVIKHARGEGIARKLILDLLATDYCKNIDRIQATVSPSNTASLALFRSLARDLKTNMTVEDYFDSALFPGQQHEKEDLITIGPFRY